MLYAARSFWFVPDSAVLQTNAVTNDTQSQVNCKIYIIDPSTELAPDLGIPPCDLTLTSTWPFGSSNLSYSTVDGLQNTPHWAAQHASGYWISQALKASDQVTTDPEEADLYYVDTHCYWMWYESLWHESKRNKSTFDPFNPVANYLSRLFVEGVFNMKAFTRSAGRRMIISRPAAGVPPGAMMDVCARLKRSFILASEPAVFCDVDRYRVSKGESLILPLVVLPPQESLLGGHSGPFRFWNGMERRNTLFFYIGKCTGNKKNELWSDELGHATLMGGGPSVMGYDVQEAMLEDLKNYDKATIHVTCYDPTTEPEPLQSIIMQEMRQSTFCAVLPLGSQASRALPSAMLSGCIPVFFGPPYHTLFLSNDIDYASIGVFFEILLPGHEATKVNNQSQSQSQPLGSLELPLFAMDDGITLIRVASFQDAVQYLKSMKASQIAAKQKALRSQRLKAYYPPVQEPGTPNSKNRSVLGNVVINRMCDYASSVSETIKISAAERAARLDILPKLTKPNKRKDQLLEN
jgi:hypothetical protein